MKMMTREELSLVSSTMEMVAWPLVATECVATVVMPVSIEPAMAWIVVDAAAAAVDDGDSLIVASELAFAVQQKRQSPVDEQHLAQLIARMAVAVADVVAVVVVVGLSLSLVELRWVHMGIRGLDRGNDWRTRGQIGHWAVGRTWPWDLVSLGDRA